jgi:hypothetical protein
MLQVNAKKRITLAEVKRHVFITDNGRYPEVRRPPALCRRGHPG